MAAIALTRVAAIGLLVAAVPAASSAASGVAARGDNYAAIAAALGLICGSPIPQLPRVMSVGNRNFKALLTKFYSIKGGSLRRGDIALTAFYRPGKNVAVVTSGSGQGQRLARTVAGIRWIRRMVIFHEFVRARQYQRIPWLRASLRDAPIVAQALLAGKDEQFTFHYAQANKIFPLVRREQRFVRSLRGAAGQRAMTVYFEFRRDYRFIRYLHIREA